MSQDHDETENKSYADAVGGDGDDAGETVKERRPMVDEEDGSESLYSLVCITIGSILFPDSKTGYASSSPLLQRIRNSFAENGPKLREASKKTSREILQWTRRGSYLRALLVITMGTIGLVTTMALVVFALFFVAATFNAIIISLLVSLAAAGGFLALFFLSLAGIYIGALSVAAFVVSTLIYRLQFSGCFRFICPGWIGFSMLCGWEQ
ncbi:hypothetical protein HID58_045417, partial [Brassica napus]